MRIHRGQLHKTMRLLAKLPADFEGRFKNVPVYEWWIDHPHGILKPWAYLTIVISPSRISKHSKKSSAHRVFFECLCGKLIPVGRSHQHLPACDAYRSPK